MMVKKDLIDLEINLNITEIKLISKDSFKDLVKKRLTILTFRELIQKKEEHSKMKKVKYNKFEIQSYLTNPKIHKNQMKGIFKFRTHMLPHFKENFEGSEEEILCSLCNVHRDHQNEIQSCEILKASVPDLTIVEELYTGNVTEELTNVLSELLEFKH